MIAISNIIFSLVMGFLMSGSITLATTFARIGAAENFLWVWLEVWAVAYPVAIVCILIYRPIASKITLAIAERLLRK
jgi:hypothetical protein